MWNSSTGEKKPLTVATTLKHAHPVFPGMNLHWSNTNTIVQHVSRFHQKDSGLCSSTPGCNNPAMRKYSLTVTEYLGWLSDIVAQSGVTTARCMISGCLKSFTKATNTASEPRSNAS